MQRDAAGEIMFFARLIMLASIALVISCGSNIEEDTLTSQDVAEWMTDCVNGEEEALKAIAGADDQSDLADVQQWLDSCPYSDTVDMFGLEAALWGRSTRRWQAHVVMMDVCPDPWVDFQPLSLNVTVKGEERTLWGKDPEIMEKFRHLEVAYKVACHGGTPEEYLESVKLLEASVHEAHKEVLNRILAQFYWDTLQRKKLFSMAHRDLRETYPLSQVLQHHPLFLENFLFGGGKYGLMQGDLEGMRQLASSQSTPSGETLYPEVRKRWFGALSPAQLRQVQITPEQYKEAVRNVLNVFTTSEQGMAFMEAQVAAGQDQEVLFGLLYDVYRRNGDNRAAFNIARDLDDQRRIREMEQQAMRELHARGEYIIVVDRHGNESRGYDLSKWR